MPVERLLQIHVAVLAALGTLLLGMGQQKATLPVLAIFAAVTSVYFTDILRWFWLNRTLGNIAAIGGLLVASYEFFYENPSEQQLLAIANLLVYLQIVLLYQKKNERRYWYVMVLSLLQVVVAAALNL